MHEHDRDLLKAARFDHPDRIPVSFGFNAACWAHYGEALVELMRERPDLFPQAGRIDPSQPPRYEPWRRAGERYVDSWGCAWETSVNGMTGAVVEHPLADWSKLADYQPPDPSRHWGWGAIDRGRETAKLIAARESGRLVRGGLRHGHTFLTLTYVRGYENVVLDMADDDPRLHAVLGMIEGFNAAQVQRYVDLGVEWMAYPEDLGMQVGPMLSPEQFRRFIEPIYRRLMLPARQAGAVVHMHSDGDVRTLANDLIEAGVEVLNIQDRVNGVEWMAEHLKGRVAIDLDIDRQSVTRFGTPSEIHAWIDHAVRALDDPAGGLMLRFGLMPGAPLENVAAVMDAMRRARDRG